MTKKKEDGDYIPPAKKKSPLHKILEEMYDEADHILGTVKEIQKTTTLAEMKAMLSIIRDDAMAIKEMVKKTLPKKNAGKEAE
jgi:hypothetical protein